MLGLFKGHGILSRAGGMTGGLSQRRGAGIPLGCHVEPKHGLVLRGQLCEGSTKRELPKPMRRGLFGER